MTELQRARFWRQAYRNEIAEIDREIVKVRERLTELERWRAQSVAHLDRWSAKVTQLESEGDPPS